MEELKSLASVLLCVLCLCSAVVNGSDYVKYNTGAGVVAGKLNVHLVAHSHDDVGWLKTVDQYYVGSNNSIQSACVENVLDSVVEALRRDPNRKFVFAEMHFNKTPKAGWQIDPFGHSAVQAYLLGVELGFDSVHFARIDYQDRAKRKEDKSLEVIWRGSKTFGSSSQIFTNAFPVHYSPPSGFHFELTDDFDPVQDNPLLDGYNVEQWVNDFIDAALTQANVTRDNHIMWTMGDDFQYQYAESWFKQMDKLIHYVNKGGRVNALYSTPSLYTEAKNAANGPWPLKTDDYFPYADRRNAYWTGFFTSRPALKGYVRVLSGFYLASRQLEFLAGKKSPGPTTSALGDALGIAQHHDAVTGTAKQHTTNDYAKRLAIGASEAEVVVSSSLSCLASRKSGDQCTKPASTFSQVVAAYNPLGWNRTDIIRIPVNDANLIVKDPLGNAITVQYVNLDNVTSNLRKFYTEAYLGQSSKQVPRYWLLFQVTVPPLGWNTYFISRAAGKVKRRKGFFLAADSPQDKTVEVGPGNLKMSFSRTTGQLKRMYNSRTGVDVPIQQSFLWYGSMVDTQSSGAYIFRPNGAQPNVVSRSVPIKIIRGPLVDEVHQQFNSWIYQVTRLYIDKEHAEVEYTIGPIPTEDSVGKEVISRMTANMVTEKVRDYRADWSLQVNEPVAGNYYPLNLGIFITDKKSEFSVLVDRATGGASIKDGQVEIMLHRRMLADDGRGVGEALDESVCVRDNCEGLTVRGNYYLSVNQLGAGARWRRTTGQEVYSPLLLAFTQEKLETWTESHLTKSTAMESDYSLPLNVALITLQELDDGSVLLRLAHLYEEGEDAEYSTLAKVELKKMFKGKSIKQLKEMSLSANQEKLEMKKMTWKVEGESGKTHSPVRGGPVDASTLVVELGPMEIRTFLLKF
ncbi:putative alpha-mannosidase [Citrus sinensis]|uniref:Alpha-mannosidase n=1 Tax=Citrus sinensis TaxID=2711 RepID=A0ACB8J1Z2_CITSI|nr:putative alpha-mannosidase [Citrus sinensis]